MIKKNILITSASSKVSLIHLLSQAASKISNDLVIIPSDSNQNVISRYLFDSFKVMPRTNSANLEVLIKFLVENNIDIIFPTRDGELEFWAKNKEKLNKLNMKVIVSDFNSIINCLDKLKFYKFGEKNYFNFIQTFTKPKHLDSKRRYVVKKRFGSGSDSVFLNLSKNDSIKIAKKVPNSIFQPFIEGQEFSADAWLNKKSIVKGIVLRRRDLVINGESQVSTTFKNKKIEDEIITILEKLKLIGPIVIQGIIDIESNVHIIECNPRFGGASSLSIKAGLDSLYWSLYESFGLDVDKLKFNFSNKEICQIRIPKDTFKYGSNF